MWNLEIREKGLDGVTSYKRVFVDTLVLIDDYRHSEREFSPSDVEFVYISDRFKWFYIARKGHDSKLYAIERYRFELRGGQFK